MRELLPILLACDDGCLNTHYSKVVHVTDDCGETDVPCKGHSLLCFLDSNCKSKLRILRSVFAHYPTLRSFLRAVYVTPIISVDHTVTPIISVGHYFDEKVKIWGELTNQHLYFKHHTAALGNSSCIIQDNCGSCTSAVSQSGISI